MPSRDGSSGYRPSILSAAWHYRWLVLGAVIVSLVVGLYWTATQPTEYAASARLVIDPRGTVVSESDTVSTDRYIAVQIVVLRSERVAELAAESAQRISEEPAGGYPSVAELLVNTELITPQGTDLIQIRHTAESPGKAVVGANALADAYQELRRSEAVASATAAIARVDALIENVDSDLAAIKDEIDTLRTGQSAEPSQVLDALESQLADSLERLVELQASLSDASEAEAALIRQQINDIAQQITLYQAVRGLSEQDPDVAALIQQQQAAIDRRAQLAERRDTLAVDAELVNSGVVSFLPAESAAALGSGNLIRTAIVMVVFGGMVGSALAYLLMSRRQSFVDRHGPQPVLGAPLLADIPDFDEEDIDDLVPVRSEPHSVAAEAFRFALAALDLRMGALESTSAVVASASIGAGKTVFVANTALAAVRKGSRVLAVDGDFGNQALTRLLTGSDEARPGLMEAIEAHSTGVQRYIEEIPWLGGNLSLLSRGIGRMSAVDFFRSGASFELFSQLTEQFDLVLIDSPSMLQVAYGSLLARHADSVVVLVQHGESVAKVEELANRIEFVARPIVGYVYNKAPLRPEMALSEGSLRELRRREADIGGRHVD